MKQDEIIAMARQVGYPIQHPEWQKATEEFAALVEEKVAAKEREACAKLCETARETIWEYHEEHLKSAACNVCTNLAAAIRARGEQA